jgi:hypothetical protein
MCESHSRVLPDSMPESVRGAIRALSPGLTPYQMDIEISGLLVVVAASRKHAFHEDLVELALSYVDDLDNCEEDIASIMGAHIITVLEFLFEGTTGARSAFLASMQHHPRYPHLLK